MASEWVVPVLGGQIPFLLSKPSSVTFWVLQCYTPAPTSWSFGPPLDVWVSSPMGRERCWKWVHRRSWLLGVGGALWSRAEVTELLETTPGLKMEWSGMFSCLWVILTSSQDRSHMCFSCTCQQKLDTRHTPTPTTGSRQRSISACSSPLPHTCAQSLSPPVPPPFSSPYLPSPPSSPSPPFSSPPPLFLCLSPRYGIQSHLNNSSYRLGPVQFSCSVVSNALPRHGLQHARLGPRRLQSPRWWTKTHVPNSITWEMYSSNQAESLGV